MKDVALVRLASLPAAPLSAPRLHSGDVTYPVEINHLFSTNLGVSTARLHQPNREGTGKIVALACRHVVMDEHQPNEDHFYDESDPDSQLTKIQHGDGAHRDMMELITNHKSNLEA